MVGLAGEIASHDARKAGNPVVTQTDPRTESPQSAEGSERAPLQAPHSRYRFGLAYGRFIYRARWFVLAFWLVALVASVPFASKIGGALRGGGFTLSGSESVQVENMLQSHLNTPPSQAIIVLQSNTTPVSDSAYQQEIQRVIASARAATRVTAAQQGPVSADGRTTVVFVNYGVDEGTAGQYIAALRQALPQNLGPAQALVSGNPATYADLSAITQRDLEKAETYSLPLALLVLLIVFGTLIAGVMPLVLALAAVPVALAVIDVVATHTWTSIFVLNVATVIGLGISIDYSLIMTRRFREEIANGRPIQDAVGWTVATTGEAILFSGLTVMIGFTAMLLIGIPVMSSFGIGGAVVVGSALLAALTLLPALLGALGPRVNALRLPLVGRLTSPRAATERQHGFWHRWALGVMRRPVTAIVAVVALLIVAGVPIFSLNPAAYGASPIPNNVESQRGFSVLTAQFPQMAQSPIEVTAQTPDGSSMLDAANLARVRALSTWLAAQPNVTSVTSLTSLPQTAGGQAPSADQLTALYTTGAYAQQPALAQLVSTTTNGDFTVLTVTANAAVDSEAGKQLVTTLRAGDAAAAQGLIVRVGGIQARSVDFTNHLYGQFPKALAFMLVATYLLLLVMFRSLLLPLKAVLVNLLSLSASFGVLVFVFQQGHGQSLFGFTSNGTIDALTPILIFCILFGLSMDYEVFLLSRIREEWLRTRNNRYAVARGLEMTGGVITSAALLFSIVTGSLLFASLLSTKELGMGMTVAVLVDATIIRSVLVPATMRLLGRWNWWLPGRPLPREQTVVS